jgi:glycosyltransferase involved in cell wall biosynthesis
VRSTIPNAELRIYGSRNPFLDRMMEMVKKQGMEGSVHYLGPKPLEKIVEAIEESDVGVIPNLRNIFTELNTPTPDLRIPGSGQTGDYTKCTRDYRLFR